jgi:hypothetical protein
MKRSANSEVTEEGDAGWKMAVTATKMEDLVG